MTTAPARRRIPDASMELLNAIQRDTIDPEYAAHAAGGDRRPSRAPWLVVLVCVLAGLMFTTSGLGAGRGASDVAAERAELIAQVETAGQRNADLRARSQALTDEVRTLEAELLGGQSDADPATLVGSATVPVTGPGVVLTLNDNPRDANGLIVDQDLRQVANGLWLAGAEAIAINGHRLSARTAIRQAGSAVTVDYRSMTTPYRIEAIGDPQGLASGFNAGPGGSWLSFLKLNYGVAWSIDQQRDLSLSADAGLDVDRARVR